MKFISNCKKIVERELFLEQSQANVRRGTNHHGRKYFGTDRLKYWNQ